MRTSKSANLHPIDLVSELVQALQPFRTVRNVISLLLLACGACEPQLRSSSVDVPTQDLASTEDIGAWDTLDSLPVDLSETVGGGNTPTAEMVDADAVAQQYTRPALEGSNEFIDITRYTKSKVAEYSLSEDDRRKLCTGEMPNHLREALRNAGANNGSVQFSFGGPNLFVYDELNQQFGSEQVDFRRIRECEEEAELNAGMGVAFKIKIDF